MKKLLLILSLMSPAVHAMHNQPSIESLQQSIDNLKRLDALQEELLQEQSSCLDKFDALNQELDATPLLPSLQENATFDEYSHTDESLHTANPAYQALSEDYHRRIARGKSNSEKIVKKIKAEENRNMREAKVILAASVTLITLSIWQLAQLSDERG